MKIDYTKIKTELQVYLALAASHPNLFNEAIEQSSMTTANKLRARVILEQAREKFASSGT